MNVGPFRTTLLQNQTVDETTSEPRDCRGYTYLGGILTGVGTTSSGVVTIEQAVYDPMKEPKYGGTWSPITTLNASDVNNSAQKVYQFTASDYCFVRARISTVIGGGGDISFDLTGHS